MSETGVVLIIIVVTIVFILILTVPGLNRWEARLSKNKYDDKDIDKNSLGIQKDKENGAETQKRTTVVHTVTRS